MVEEVVVGILLADSRVLEVWQVSIDRKVADRQDRVVVEEDGVRSEVGIRTDTRFDNIELVVHSF